MTDSLPALPLRHAESHKGDFGSALFIGGGRGMAGAVGLASIAALRSGAGRVTAATPAGTQAVVASFEPCVMTSGLPDDSQGFFAAIATDKLLSLAGPMSSVALGTGLGRSPNLTELVVKLSAELAVPTVIDADALYALAEFSAPNRILQSAPAPRILTPHAGEWARLIGVTGPTHSTCEAEALAWSAAHKVVLVLKGHRTLVTDGTQCYYNTTGNPGMATGGSGDVLTGVITGLLAQGMPAWDAARVGVYLHGLAGDLAAKEKGEVGLIASDLLAALPAAIQTHHDEA